MIKNDKNTKNLGESLYKEKRNGINICDVLPYNFGNAFFSWFAVVTDRAELCFLWEN